MATPKSTPKTLTERLVEGSMFDTETGCIVWMRYTRPNGYGSVSVKGRMKPAHRASYELFAPIPDGLVLDHLCRNRACINPQHLEPVTVSENNLRGEGCMADYARRTHCPQGHPYDDENTWMQYGARRCRACKREENRQYRETVKKRKAEEAARASAAPHTS